MTVLFWFCVLSIAGVYFLYPIMLWLAGRGKPLVRPDGPRPESMTLIICVRNEERMIRQRIENIMGIKRPEGDFEFIVVSDGSTDRTNEMAEALARKYGFVFLPLENWKGKARAQDEAVKHARGEILVFSDATVENSDDDLLKIASYFKDSEIGMVDTAAVDVSKGARGESLYLRYDHMVKFLESRLRTTFGSYGSFYAMRKKLFPDFAVDIITDFAHGLAVARQGYRVVFDPKFLIKDHFVPGSIRQFRRKVRIILRAMTALFVRLPGTLDIRRHGMLAVSMWIHKVLRWAVPIFWIGSMAAGAALASGWFYLLIFIGQCMFVFSGILGILAERAGINRPALLRVVSYFCAVNSAALIAWIRFILGHRIETWDPDRE